MKREILFRGKRVDNSEWVEGALWDKCSSGCTIISGDGTDRDCFAFVDPETVGQFIGITDKNGSNIFEGDIISNWEFICPLIIGFNNESASFCGSKTNEFETEKCYWFFNDIVMTDGWEIIGSIHDNPELLIPQ